MTLADIRTQYPEYNDMNDRDLAVGFHKKFYSDIPFSEFSTKIGFLPKEKILWAPEDPEAPVEYRQLFTKEPAPIFKAMDRGMEFLEKMGGYGRKGAGYGLGAMTYPFKSMEHTLATPVEQVFKGWIPIGTQAQMGVDWEEIKKTPSAALSGLKSWAHFRETPKGAKDFTDVVGTYYEGLTGEPASKWLTYPAGIAISFAVTPYAVGKLFKEIGTLPKAIPAIQRYAKQNALWRRMLTRSHTRTAGQIEKAKQLAHSVGKKEAQKLAQELSAATGKPIHYKAVQQRLAQIVSGSITTQPSLAAKANPIIDEFRSNLTLLQKYGILGKELYTTKLPKKRIAELLTKKTKLTQQIARLEKPPYKDRLLKLAGKLKIRNKEKIASDLADLAMAIPQDDPVYFIRLAKTLKLKTTPQLTYLITNLHKGDVATKTKLVNKMFKLSEQTLGQEISGLKPLFSRISSMQRRFPGKAKKAAQLQAQVDDITRTVQESYKLGGTEYFPRMYLEKEAAALGRRKFPFAAKRVRAPYAKRRMDIPAEARKAMGEIKTVPYPVQKRLIQEAADIETAKLFQQVQRRGMSSPLPNIGWKKLPHDKAYGVLRDSYVPSRVYDDITAMAEIRSNFGQFADLLMGNWKAAKVLWNPATHFRNMFSNSMLLDGSGVHHGKQIKLLRQAVKEIRANSKDYQFAQRAFARTTLARGELLEDMLAKTKAIEGKGKVMQRILNFTSKVSARTSKTPGKIYEKEEFIGKFVKYLEQRQLGKSPMHAVEQANKWLFDYSDLAGWERKIARRVMPFYTFPRKATPRILEWVAERPHSFAKYPLLASTMTKYSLAKLDISEKDWSELQETLPEYMQRGSYILMPYRDANNDLRFFDWTYVIPWGPISEVQERGALDVIVSNPLVQIVADLQRNKDSFTGRRIWDDTIPESDWTPEYRKEQNYKKMEHVWRTLVPSLAWKGIYWEKLHDAAIGIPTKAGKKRLLPETVAHTIFGMRTQPIDVKEAKKWHIFSKQKSSEEIQKRLLDIAIRAGRGNITQEEYQRKREMLLEELRQIHNRKPLFRKAE